MAPPSLLRATTVPTGEVGRWPRDIARTTAVLLTLAMVSLCLYVYYAQFATFQRLGLTFAGSTEINASTLELAQMALYWMAAYMGCALGLVMLTGKRLRPVTGLEKRVVTRQVAFAVGAALYTWARFAFNEQYTYATLDLLVSGEAHAPFQYRVAVPAIARVLYELAPVLSLDAWFVVLEWASACALAHTFVYLAREARPGSDLLRGLAILALVGTVNAMPIWINTYYYPADTLAVAVFCGGLVAVRQKRLGVLLLIMAIGTLNRETTCFLGIAYVAVHARRWDVTPWLHAAAMAAVWFGVKVTLKAFFPEIPSEQMYNDATLIREGGTLFVNMTERNLRFLGTVVWAPYLLSAFGGLAIPAVLLRNRIRSSWVRRLGWTALPFVGGMSVVGLLIEIRIFAELAPLVALAWIDIRYSIGESCARGYAGDGVSEDTGEVDLSYRSDPLRGESSEEPNRRQLALERTVETTRTAVT